MWWAIFKYAVTLFAATVLVMVISTNVQAWSGDEPVNYVVSKVKDLNSGFCAGSHKQIPLSMGGLVEACVMGGLTQVASYPSSYGAVSYVIKFPNEMKFHPLSVCGNVPGCVYSEESDSFVTFHSPDQGTKKLVIYTNFVRNLQKWGFAAMASYGLKADAPNFSTASLKDFNPYVYAFALSDNGKWLFLEARDYGFFRVDTESRDVRRVIPGTRYALGVSRGVEMDISNDGRMVAVMGYNMGHSVISVNETCGDIPNIMMQMHFESSAVACPAINTALNVYAPQFMQAYNPAFSRSGNTFSFDVHANGVEPRHVTLFLNDETGANRKYYLAIGDSFTSGEGETDDAYYIGGETNRCHISSRSYPYLLADAWNVPGQNAACSGATIETAKTQELSNQRTQLEEVEYEVPHIVSVGIGGNDAGLMGKLKACVGFDTCDWAETVEKRQATALEIKNLYSKLKQFYQELDRKVLGEVIVIGYPAIISDEPVCSADVGFVLNQTERQFMNEGIRYLNLVIKAAATDAGMKFVDVEPAFAGNELCSTNTSPSMNGIRIGGEYSIIQALPDLKVIGAESFHPTPYGQKQLADTILHAIPTLDSLEGCANCVTSSEIPEPDEYWGEAQNTPRQQFTFPFINKVTITKGDTFKISLPAFSFEPSTEVTVELHSETQTIQIAESREDGSIGLDVSSEGFESGFHSIHLLGKNFNGDDIAIYDFITVEDKTNVLISSVSISSNLPKIPQASLRSVSNSADAPEVTQNPLGVLGVSMDAIKLNTKLNLADNKIPSAKHDSLLLLIGIVTAVATLGTIGYMFYRRKKSRYPDG
ncbi:MAG: SGNH/GDSL hydrolase family protein [Patescibacteria group bacterium]